MSTTPSVNAELSEDYLKRLADVQPSDLPPELDLFDEATARRGLRLNRAAYSLKHEEQRRLPHEGSRQRQLLPLSKTDLHAFGPCRPQLRLQSGGELVHDIGRAGVIDGCRHRRQIVQVRQVADANSLARLELEAEKVLKRS